MGGFCTVQSFRSPSSFHLVASLSLRLLSFPLGLLLPARREGKRTRVKEVTELGWGPECTQAQCLPAQQYRDWTQKAKCSCRRAQEQSRLRGPVGRRQWGREHATCHATDFRSRHTFPKRCLPNWVDNKKESYTEKQK